MALLVAHGRRLLHFLIDERTRRRVEAALDGCRALGEPQPVVHQALPRQRAHLRGSVSGRWDDRTLEKGAHGGEDLQRPVLERMEEADAARVAHRLLLRLEQLSREHLYHAVEVAVHD